MAYDPKSDLTVLEVRNVIESFDELGPRRYGVTVGDDGSLDSLFGSLPDHAKFDQHDEYVIVVEGHSVSALRT